MKKMKQKSFLAEEIRLERLSEMGDPLEQIKNIINWEIFRPLLDKAFYIEPKGPGGRPPMDRVMMFKIVMLQKWYGIADDNTEYVINDRLSFQRFLGLTLDEKVPDAKTIWAFKERLKESEVDIELFMLFASQMEDRGIVTRTGSIIDASFMEAPRQRNSRKENKTIKNGEIPEEWLTEENKAMLSQKDTDARWTKKNNETHYGYKDHIKIDQESKIITAFTVTPASTHDSQCIIELLDKQDKKAYLDSAYTGVDLHRDIRTDYPNIALYVIEKSKSNTPLTEEQRESNRDKSRIRVRVEHVFGHMVQAMEGMRIRSIGIDRAVREAAMKNLAYNIQRFSFLVRSKKATALI
jgi:IS5 family transposase